MNVFVDKFLFKFLLISLELIDRFQEFEDSYTLVSKVSKFWSSPSWSTTSATGMDFTWEEKCEVQLETGFFLQP